MKTIIFWLKRWLIRIFLLLAAVVFFVCLLIVATLLLTVWVARALWARLTGKPVSPWVFRVDPRAHWSGFGSPPSRGPRAQSVPEEKFNENDVTDVIPREIKGDAQPLDHRV